MVVITAPCLIFRQARQAAGALADSGRVIFFESNVPADETLSNVALGSTALGGTAADGCILNSPQPTWIPALEELLL